MATTPSLCPSPIARRRSLRAPGPPSTGQIWVCPKIEGCPKIWVCPEIRLGRKQPRAYRGLASPIGALRGPCRGMRVRVPPPGSVAARRPRRRLANWGSARGCAARPPTGNWPAPRGPRHRTAHLGWLAGSRRPTAAAGRERRHGGRGTPARRRRRASRLARGVTPGLPTAHSPAAPGPPPQSTLQPQPGAAGPAASRLAMYSPTPFGWGFCRQPLTCTKDFPGAALSHVSGPCTIFFSPYNVGHPVSPGPHI